MAAIPCILLSKRQPHPHRPPRPGPRPSSREPTLASPGSEAERNDHFASDETGAVRKLLRDTARYLGLIP